MDHNLILMIIWSIILIMAIANLVLTIKKKKYPDGVIRVNTHDPEKDTYTLELHIPFGELEKREDVIFKIIHE